MRGQFRKQAWASHEPNLPTVAFSYYYFTRSTALNRIIITNDSKRNSFHDPLTATLEAHGAHLHFVHMDQSEMHLECTTTSVW